MDDEYYSYANNQELPPPPEKPFDIDCCGQNCNPCVFDIYEKDLIVWKKNCYNLLHGIEEENNCVADGNEDEAVFFDSFTPLRLLSIKQLLDNINIYRFQLPDNKLLQIYCGQHLILGCQTENGWLSRQYTPISSCDTHGYFDVLIKLYVNGKMSQQIREWYIGQEILWKGPFGNFNYHANTYRKIVMLAAGTGIAPMLQVIRCVIKNEEDETFVHLILAARYYSDLVLKPELDSMKEYWNIKTEYVLSSETDRTKFKYGDCITIGRIDNEFVNTILPKPSADVKVLICGTKSFEKDMIKYLRKANFDDDMYFKF